MGTPETATLSSRMTATITVTARTMYPCAASLDHVYARAEEEQLDEAARGAFAAPGMIEDAVVVFAGGQRRDLR